MNARDIMTLGRIEYDRAVKARADRWVPACGGNEIPYRDKLGRMVLYVFNPATGKHGFLDMGQDIVFEDHDLTTATS